MSAKSTFSSKKLPPRPAAHPPRRNKHRPRRYGRSGCYITRMLRNLLLHVGTLFDFREYLDDQTGACYVTLVYGIISYVGNAPTRYPIHKHMSSTKTHFLSKKIHFPPTSTPKTSTHPEVLHPRRLALLPCHPCIPWTKIMPKWESMKLRGLCMQQKEAYNDCIE